MISSKKKPEKIEQKRSQQLLCPLHGGDKPNKLVIFLLN